jgi:hypothetical protein
MVQGIAQVAVAQPADDVLINRMAALGHEPALTLMQPGEILNTHIQNQAVRVINATNHLIGFSARNDQQAPGGAWVGFATAGFGGNLSFPLEVNQHPLTTFRVVHQNAAELENIPDQPMAEADFNAHVAEHPELQPLVALFQFFAMQFNDLPGMNAAYVAFLAKTRSIHIIRE